MCEIFYLITYLPNVVKICFYICFSEQSAKQQSSMICMLKVPATFSSQDLLQFIAPVEYVSV